MTPSERIQQILASKYANDPYNLSQAIVDWLNEQATTVSTSTTVTTAPTVTVTTPPPPTGSKWVMVNCINWNAAGLNALPVADSSELTYFVLPVSSAGVLLGGSPTLETKFVADVHRGGKKATFSVAGGSQNAADVTAAVTAGSALISNIAARITQYGYDGVTLDIENTALNPTTYANFVNALRTRLNQIRPGLIIGMYTQPYQINTVFSQMHTAAASIDWMAPMIYDFAYTLDQLKTLTLAWVPRANGIKSKVLCGIAVNYGTGLGTTQLADVCDWVKAQGLGGIGIWENTLFSAPYRDIVRTKLLS